MKKFALLAPALAMVLLGAGCAGGASTSTSGSSAVADKGISLPADFPKAIPVYANGKVDDASADSLDMTTSDSKEVVYAWYSEQLTAAGWKNTAERKEKSVAAVWEKGNQSMPISIFSVGGETTINVSLSTY
ncbi:MAG: hypothetical protein WC813_02380 [Patescibacteria group bacterium]|jgi:hypothetical protein